MVSLLAAAGASYYFISQLRVSAAAVAHTQEILKKLEEITADVATFGSNQRAFINTGNDEFLKSDEESKRAIHRDLDDFHHLAEGQPRQQERLQHLRPLIDRRIKWGDETIAVRRKEGLSAAEQVIATGQGMTLSDSIRRQTKEMEDAEYSMLDDGRKQEETVSISTFHLLPLGVFFSIALLSLGLFFLNAGVAEQTRAEQKAAWLASFPERNPNPVVEFDPAAGLINYVNPATVRLFPDLQAQGSKHPWLAGLTEMMTTLCEGHQESVRREIQVGSRFFAQIINCIAETKLLRVYGTDITERKQAEDAAAQLAAIVEFSDDAIIGKDLQGIVTSWNAGAVRTFGYAALEMVGQPVTRLIPPDRMQEETESSPASSARRYAF